MLFIKKFDCFCLLIFQESSSNKSGSGIPSGPATPPSQTVQSKKGGVLILLLQKKTDVLDLF